MVRILALNVGLNDGWVKPRTLKMVFVASHAKQTVSKDTVKPVRFRIMICLEWSDKSTHRLIFQ